MERPLSVEGGGNLSATICSKCPRSFCKTTDPGTTDGPAVEVNSLPAVVASPLD